MSNDNFTGFVAHYKDGTAIWEKDNYYDGSVGRNRATNWAAIDQNAVDSLELWWRGSLKERLAGENFVKWVFFNTAAMSPGSPPKIISRTIGFVRKAGVNDMEFITTVNEETGKASHRIKFLK